MDRRLLEAAISGDAAKINQLAIDEPSVLLGTTPQGNTCLHIAIIHGNKGFSNGVLELDVHQSRPLVVAINADEETPLLTAVTRGRATLASDLLRYCRAQQLSETILKQDKRGGNALHHAIRRGYRTLALKLIEAEPGLSKAVNECYQSPMYSAVMRNYHDVLEKLLEIPAAAHGGARGYNALHAAVTSGNAVMAKMVMEARPELFRQENEEKRTPVHLAAHENKIDVLTVLLEHDPSLGYFVSSGGSPLLCIAATKGNVCVARELLRHCPDPPYYDAQSSTCLHIAVSSGQADFVRFVARSPQLHHLVNLPNDKGETALQLAHRIMPAGDEQKRQTMKSMVAVLEFYLNNLNIHAEPFMSGMMDERLVEAAIFGHVAEMSNLSHDNPGVLLGRTPQGNTCLHIASIHGHQEFCREVQALEPSLLEAVNSEGETPLLAAVKSGRVSVASVLLRSCRNRELSKKILKQDNRGSNALHHAIRSGHRKLALELIEAEPALSQAVNQYGESTMFVAVMRNYEDVFEKLLEIPDSAHEGAYGYNALHAAVRNGNSDIAERIMMKRPGLARQVDNKKNTPIQLAVSWDKTEVLRVLLKHDRSLGYSGEAKSAEPLLFKAAYEGHVGVARVLLEHCPDAPYRQTNGYTCLHHAVRYERTEFVKFVLASPQLHRLINMRDEDDETPLHLAVKRCNPNMVEAFLHYEDIDVTMLNDSGVPPIQRLAGSATDHAKTLNWNEVSMLMLKADPQYATSISNIYKDVKYKVTDTTRKDIKSLTQKYTSSTSVVATLIASSTFAAAFTMSKGYSSDAGNVGRFAMASKFTFHAFVIADGLAMCSSLAVAFICIIARWEDLEFLLYYRSLTKKIMWFAYMATTTAFATGLFTVLAPHFLWLAVAVCFVTSLLPILTMLLGEWPILKLRTRLGRTFKSELLDMV